MVRTSLSPLGLGNADIREIMRSPDNYLSSRDEVEAARIRSVLIPAYQRGFRIVFIICACLSALAFFLAVFLMPQIPLNRPDDETLKQEAKGRVQEKKEEEA